MEKLAVLCDIVKFLKKYKLSLTKEKEVEDECEQGFNSLAAMHCFKDQNQENGKEKTRKENVLRFGDTFWKN